MIVTIAVSCAIVALGISVPVLCAIVVARQIAFAVLDTRRVRVSEKQAAAFLETLAAMESRLEAVEVDAKGFAELVRNERIGRAKMRERS